jgi:hypothetical protein
MPDGRTISYQGMESDKLKVYTMNKYKLSIAKVPRLYNPTLDNLLSNLEAKRSCRSTNV